ncbi:Transmembrane domain-containing protein [Spironucleus salmonicida]|uniref:Transmembrane domain-containing protein n=1 Tax=Spironucleus salmonicida TaxID=348837 RepID=V6M0P1_9EUKA|nr:Transmembrane domain-containing protein [Spironucleus salmonicida]KAH0575038.1 Transmembrane domain-containing protein [Spironucleus salmonicida]|eukprot:EST45846.1 Transmembrane domain-containing protein [Spironucleus salmonicida]
MDGQPQLPSLPPPDFQLQPDDAGACSSYSGWASGSAQTVAAGMGEVLSVRGIFCSCAPPRYQRCQKEAGLLTMAVPGFGLLCCVSCYGAERLDRCSVVLAGLLMHLSSYVLVGWVVACMVGWRMIVLQ